MRASHLHTTVQMWTNLKLESQVNATIEDDPINNLQDDETNGEEVDLNLMQTYDFIDDEEEEENFMEEGDEEDFIEVDDDKEEEEEKDEEDKNFIDDED
ncbi:hypothetical protein VNO78_19640 [Psophocarpus tetragonolobus]|uniref:Uncharacterized protein n=1 Tax=Psophocarpus tetragonolobus TaxID=3891 RepID=A0AAN9S7W5_PSOTE